MKALRVFVSALLALACSAVFGDVRVGDTLVGATLQGGRATVSFSIPSGTSLPATCAVGQLFFKTNVTAGQNVYECAATDTWTQEAGTGGGGGGSGTVNSGTTGQLAYYSGNGNAVDGLTLVPATAGGTGVANNSASTFTITGAYPLTLTLSGSTALTAPTSGTILTTANAPTFSAKATGGINYWDSTASPGNVANAVITGPICGNGTGAPAVCSLSGNTAVVMTKGTGSLVSGNCAKFDASGNVIDSGGACGAGSMTYPSGTGIAVVTSGTSWGTTIAPGTGVATALAVNTNTAGAFGVLIAKGTATINPGALASGSCSSAIDGGTATGVATTDSIEYSFNADPTAATGYSGVGTLVTLYKYPTADHVNFKVCNWTGSSITPASVTLNWRVAR